MRLGGQMDETVELMLLEQLHNEVLVGDVALDEMVVGLAVNVGQILQVAGISQVVEVEDFVLGVLVHEEPHDVGSDKAGAAGDEYFFHNSYYLLYVVCVETRHAASLLF